MLLKDIIKLRSCREWFTTLPVFLLLLAVIIAGNGEQIHARLLNVGELIWQDYFILRADISTPDCNQDPDIEAELEKLKAEATSLDGMEDLFDAEPFDHESTLISLQNSRLLCKEKHLYRAYAETVLIRGFLKRVELDLPGALKQFEVAEFLAMEHGITTLADRARTEKEALSKEMGVFKKFIETNPETFQAQQFEDLAEYIKNASKVVRQMK